EVELGPFADRVPAVVRIELAGRDLGHERLEGIGVPGDPVLRDNLQVTRYRLGAVTARARLERTVLDVAPLRPGRDPLRVHAGCGLEGVAGGGEHELVRLLVQDLERLHMA